jgi:hypothetical protein
MKDSTCFCHINSYEDYDFWNVVPSSSVERYKGFVGTQRTMVEELILYPED